MKWILFIVTAFIGCKNRNNNVKPSTSLLDSIQWKMNDTVKHKIYEQPAKTPMKCYLVIKGGSVRKLNWNVTLHCILKNSPLLLIEQPLDSIMSPLGQGLLTSRNKDLMKKDTPICYIICDSTSLWRGMMDSTLTIDTEGWLLLTQIDKGWLTQASPKKFFLKTSTINQLEKAYDTLVLSYDRYTIENVIRQKTMELEAQYSLREKNSRTKTWIIITTIVIAVLLLIMIGLLLFRNNETQMLLRESYLKQRLLRAQMNPHILGNMISILPKLLRAREIDRAMNYVNSFARLMRFNFENASENFVRLRNEIEALEAYLTLQVTYSPVSFAYSIKVYSGFEEDEIYIPPMLLQPFVENAIQHGFANIDYKGVIEITIAKKQQSLFCIIDDNGSGFQTVKGSKKKHSLEINQELLSIVGKQTGKPAFLNIFDKNVYNNTVHGTRIEIEIPFIFVKHITAIDRAHDSA